ncbi:host cell division inhibitor Icd-like protein [Salmonella enterica]|uniref:host cell division inhibitor Icd-like protein n=1 Tax=Salmonella enterica TaxID=28901 RepID=UPI003D31926F
MRNNRPLVLVDKKRLPVCVAGLYISSVAPHRATGFSSLITRAGSRYVSVKRYFYARYSTLTRIMAGRDGEALAPAGFSSTSLLTPSRLATPFSSEVARLHKITRGAANMAISAHLNPCPYPLFIWRFWSCQNVTYTTTATSEREARLQLPAVRLVFIARIRLKGGHHA